MTTIFRKGYEFWEKEERRIEKDITKEKEYLRVFFTKIKSYNMIMLNTWILRVLIHLLGTICFSCIRMVTLYFKHTEVISPKYNFP